MPHLTLLDKSGRRSYRVDATDAVVGRDPNATLVLDGEGSAVVSTRHARFVLADGYWYVEDVGSRNGTFVHGRRLAQGAPHRLAQGDEISFGATGPKLVVQEAVGSSFATTLTEPAPAVPMQTLMERAPVPPTPQGRQQVRVALRSGDGKRLAGQDVDVVIGRSRECTVRLEGDMALAVSRRHARIFYSGWKICIEDLGSRNGTWLNRKRVEAPTILERGDIIEFGAGGPRLTVEDVALMAPEARKTEVEMPAVQEAPADGAFVSELPTPGPLPAKRASNGGT